MATVSRYSKDTIRNQVWESSITEDNGVYILHEVHLRNDVDKVIKEVEKVITEEEAIVYKEKNKEWHIETYKR
jgi:hypothetical protein